MDRVLERKRRTPRGIAWIGASVLALALVGHFVLFTDDSTTLGAASKHLTVSVAHRDPFQETTPLTGTITPLRTIYLDAIEGGRIGSISVEPGSIVNEGDVGTHERHSVDAGEA